MGLDDLKRRGLVESLDVELARALARLGGNDAPEVELAIALTSRHVRRGHSCFPMGTPAHDLWPREQATRDALPEEGPWKDRLLQSRLTSDGPLVLDRAGRLYLRRYWQLERDIAAELAARAQVPPLVDGDPGWLQASLCRLFPAADDVRQRQAARNALAHRVSLLCGGPGTGKTTTVAAIVALIIEAWLRHRGEAPRVMLLTPTGKSAARLGEAVRRAKTRIEAPREIVEAIPSEAKTVHRALGMWGEGLHFRRDADAPLDADVIVIDEASMIDLVLMRQLLDATPPRATLLIVGDPDQLVSVEAGSVLRDLVAASSGTWWRGRVTELVTTYRYDERQPLGQLVAGVRDGSASAVEALLTGGSEGLAWSSLDQLDNALDDTAGRWAAVLATREPGRHFELRRQLVLLSPFRSGPVGTQRLGQSIRERLPPQAGEPVTPIIIEQNSHDLSIYNGDFGMLVGGDPPRAVVQTEPEGPRELAVARLPRFSEAFALTVHKAQGSEFDEVLIVLPSEDAPLLTRELVYTAVSRAKKRVRIVGPREVVRAALERRARRDSGLVDAISDARPEVSDAVGG